MIAPWAGKMNRILRCNWLPKRPWWRYLVRLGLFWMSHKKIIFSLYPGPRRVRRDVGDWMWLIPCNPYSIQNYKACTLNKLLLSLTFLRFLHLWQAFGFLSCIAFAVDMVLNHKLFQTQRAQEMPPDQGPPPQRRAWDVNNEYMRSPMFYVKLAEIVSLLKSALTLSSSGNLQNKPNGGALVSEKH